VQDHKEARRTSNTQVNTNQRGDVRAKHGAVKNVRLKEEANPREGGMSILLPKRMVQIRIFMLVPARRTCGESKTE
jgi:hypothetical protein